MPMVRYQIRNEYGLSDPALYGAAEKDDPEALLEGVAMAGLVGLLRQLGDLAEFAAEIFHDLHEEVMATASRGHELTLRLQQLEAEFPSVEKALISQISLPNVTQNAGSEWHTNVQIDQNLITRGDMPRFVMDSYEECCGPPRLFTLDKFDVAGAGACLKRYSDPSFFKTEFASSGSIETEDTPREKKPRKVKRKATRWKKGETLESLLISSSESPPFAETLSSGKAVISRVVKLKSRRLQNSDNNTRKIYQARLLELVESQQKIILEDSRRQSKIKLESNSIENEMQKMHKIFPIQEQNEASSESENIENGIEISSFRQAKEKTMADSDEVPSEHKNFVDALNTIESKSVSISSSQEEMVCGNLGSDSVKELVGTDKGLELNAEVEFGETTEEFFDNDDLMDVSSTSSLHSDGSLQAEQLSISHGNNLNDESKVPAGDNENKPGAVEKTSTVNEAQMDVEDLVCLPTQTDKHPEQTNSDLINMDVPSADARQETTETSGVVSNSQEIKFLEETPIIEDSSGSHEGEKVVIDSRSSTSLEQFEEPFENPIEASQVKLRNISEEIQNLEEYLISTRKIENVSQDIISHGGEDTRNNAITAKHLDVHTEDTGNDFAEDKFEDLNERLQCEQTDKSEDVSNGGGSLLSNGEEEVPGRSTPLPTEDAVELTTHIEGLDLEETLPEFRIQPDKDPTTITTDDYIDNSQSASIQELEASSSGPHSPINIPQGTSIQGFYPKYHMDNFIEPDEGSVDLGETQEETYRDEWPHHFEVETQTKQFNESEDWQQYLDKDVSTSFLISNEPADESLRDNCNNDVSLELCAKNPFENDIYVGADDMSIDKSAHLPPNNGYQVQVGDSEAGAKEDFGTELPVLTSLSQMDAVSQTDIASDFPETSLIDEVGELQVPEQDSEMEPCYICDANMVYHADVSTNSVGVNELLEELETKSQEIFEEGVENNEVLVETSKINEEGNAESGVAVPFELKNEVLVETPKLNKEGNAESGVQIPNEVKNEVLVEALEFNGKDNAEGGALVSSLVEFSELNDEDNPKGGVPIPSVDHVHELLQKKEEESADTGALTFLDHVHEILQESTNSSQIRHEPNSIFTSEEGNITQSSGNSLNHPFSDTGPSDNRSQQSNDLHSDKPVPCTSEPCTLDLKETMLAESHVASSSFDQDRNASQESFDLKPDNSSSGNKIIESDDVLANELDMSSAYSLASEHKLPPLPPLGWRMGGKLGKGTSLPSNGYSFKPVEEINPNPLSPKANHGDSQSVEGEKPRLMSLSDLPPISFQDQLANPNSSLIPSSAGENVQNVEYNNGSGTALGLHQYAWPDAQHPHPFLGLVQVHQPGYLVSVEDNLWAQYGIGLSIEDERLGRKHCSIRDMPRNPLIDAVAAHDRSTMRKVAELVKPDDQAKADERNSMLEQIRNKSFSLRPVGSPKTTAVKVPQTNLKVAAIVEKANAIRQAFAGSDEEDGDSWSDA